MGQGQATGKGVPTSPSSRLDKRRHMLGNMVPSEEQSRVFAVDELRYCFELYFSIVAEELKKVSRSHDPEIGTSEVHARRPPSSRRRMKTDGVRGEIATLRKQQQQQQTPLPHTIALESNRDVDNDMSEDLSRMAAYLGLDMKHDRTYLWIAEEALYADLPDDWEEYKDPEGHVYYYNIKTGQSTWNHPLDTYYKFLATKLKKMHANHRKKLQPRDMAKDRGLVDLLWVMETDQSPGGRGMQERIQGNTTEALHTAEDISRRTRTPEAPTDSRSASRSEFMSATSRTNTPGSADEGEGIVPAEVKDIARYLGIDLKLMDSPVTPDEVVQMARCLGIDARREFYLLPIAKLALQVPLPEEWEVYKDEAERPYYYNTNTGERTYRHPSDDFFLMQVRQERVKRLLSNTTAPNPEVEPWLDFMDDAGRRFYYNFMTFEHTTRPPPFMANAGNV